MTEGRVGGSNKAMKSDFAKLMALSQHGAAKKSKNFKEAKKANIRRNEKKEREWQKAMDAQIQE